MNNTDLDQLAQALREKLAREPDHPDAARWCEDLARYDAAVELGKQIKHGHDAETSS